MSSPIFAEDPDQGPSPIEQFFKLLDEEPSPLHVRDEPLGLNDVSTPLIVLEGLSIADLCHALRLKGRYHEAIEIEIERHKLRQLGKLIRADISIRFDRRHKHAPR